MTHILIVYGTTDGHTRKIAQVLAEHLRGHLCCVDVLDAAGALGRLSPEGYDGVIVAASIHIGDYQRPVGRWVRRHAAELTALPTAFLSVCLGVLEPGVKARQDVLRIMTRFFNRTGWRPTIAKLVAGALPYTRYGWLKRLMMRRLVAKAGGDTDTSRDYEYTDWDDLRDFARDFAGRVAARPVAAGGVV
jgi:menaquinone-dependent protoporphyrinogen oxidase